MFGSPVQTIKACLIIINYENPNLQKNFIYGDVVVGMDIDETATSFDVIGKNKMKDSISHTNSMYKNAYFDINEV